MINESSKNNEIKSNNNFKLKGIILSNINNSILNELYSENSKKEFNFLNNKEEFSPSENLKKKRKKINIFEELLKDE